MPTTKSIIAGFWSVVFLLVVASSSFCGTKPILKVDLKNEHSKVVITASSNTPFTINVFKSSAGRYLGFEFRGVLMNSGKHTVIRSGRLQSIKFSTYRNNPPSSRLVVSTSAAPEYTVTLTPDKKSATITIIKFSGSNGSVKIEKHTDIDNLQAAGAYQVASTANIVRSSDKLPSLGDAILAKTDTATDVPAAVAVKSAPVVAPKVQVAAKPKTTVKVVKPIKPVKPAAVVKPKPVIKTVNTKSGARITLNFSDAEIVDVLKALALQSRQDIVVSKAVGGKITLNLTSVTPEQALTYVAKISGFTYVKQGNTYLVGTKASLLGLVSNDDLNIKVEAIMLSYASPNDVISILQTRFPELKIRKSDTRWRILPMPGAKDVTTLEVRNESNRSIGQTQGQKQDSQNESGSGAGEANVKEDTDKKQSSKAINESQSGVEAESTTLTDQVSGRQEQTRDDSNMLIISGTANVVEEAKKLVVDMEKTVYTTAMENVFEIYRIKYVRADSLSRALGQLMPGISVTRAPQAGIDYSSLTVKEGDPVQAGDKAIIISGRQKDITKAMEIINRLDVAVDSEGLQGLDSPASNKYVVELITVKNVSGDDVSQALSQHFQGIKVNLISTNKDLTESENKAAGGLNKRPEIKGSVLILSGPQMLIADAKTLVAQMDSALQGALFLPEGANADQVKLEKYEVKYVNAVELANSIKTLIPAVTVTFAPSEGFDLQGPGPITISSDSGSTTVQTVAKAPAQDMPDDGKQLVPTNPKTLLLLGPDADVKRALELAPKLDVKSPQIKIVAQVTSITESGGKKLGLTWDWGSLNYNEQGPTGNWIRDPIDFGATLEALYTSGDIQILSTPSLTILEGKPGVFFVGDEITYITRVETTPTGQNVQTESKLVGIQLKVNGKISSDGNITLNLHPEVSTLRLNTNSVANVSLPTISRRFTDQIVRVKDGETYVVGGLIRNDETSDLTKIPLLGDMPFFGSFFRHSVKTKQRTEVVMFITATIINE